MKRRSAQPSTSATASSTASGKGSKRQKTSQACNSCRKSKTRCEVLEDIEKGSIRCHRCKVLGLHCSYQDMDTSELEESLRLPKVDQDKDRVSRDEVLNRTLKWEQEALGLIEMANGSALMKLSECDSNTFMIWDLFRPPEGRRFDWSAPLEVVQEMSKNVSESMSRPKGDPIPLTLPNDSLAQILTSDQIQQLLDVFSEHYVPWLNFTPIRATQNPMLDLICCTIASRELDEETRSRVAPRLQALTHESCAKLIFQSRNSDSLEAIQCLLILSLWAPVCGNSDNFSDGRMLIASAVSIALNCRLNDASDKALKLSAAKTKGEGVDESELSDAMNKSRLWLSIANAESTLCIGTGRVALSKRKYEVYRYVFPTHPALSLFPHAVDLTGGRDIRLRLLAELCDATETGINIPFESTAAADVEKWYDSLVHVFSNMSRILRLGLPLGALSDYEKFYFKMHIIHTQFCRLLLLYHALGSCRMYLRENSSSKPDLWFREIRPHGIVLAISWGKESFQLSEAVLVNLLEMDPHLLGTAPDYLFPVIAFAAGYCLASNYLVLRGLGVQVPGCTTKIVERTIAHLMQASISPDSSAYRYAKLISVMVALWENRKKELLTNPSKHAMEILGKYNPWQGRTEKPPEESPSSSDSPSASSSSPSTVPSRATSGNSLNVPSSSSSSSKSSPDSSVSPGIPVETSHPNLYSLSPNDALTDVHHQHQQPSYPHDNRAYTRSHLHPHTHASPNPISSFNPGHQSGGVSAHLTQSGNLSIDIDTSSIDFGWIDNSLFQSSDFWTDYMRDMNLPGYSPSFNVQGFPMSGYGPGQGP